MRKSNPKKFKLSSIVEVIEKQFVIIGGIATFFMMILVVVDVLGRQLFNNSVKGQMEIVELLMVVTIFLGIAYTQKAKEHVGMDLLHTKLKGVLAKVVNASTLLLSLCVYVVITYSLFKQTLSVYNKGVVSIYLQWPMWILSLFVFLGCFVLCFRLLLDIVAIFTSASSEDMEERELL